MFQSGLLMLLVSAVIDVPVFIFYFYFAGTESQVYGSHCLLRRGQRIQPDSGRIH